MSAAPSPTAGLKALCKGSGITFDPALRAFDMQSFHEHIEALMDPAAGDGVDVEGARKYYEETIS